MNPPVVPPQRRLFQSRKPALDAPQLAILFYSAVSRCLLVVVQPRSLRERLTAFATFVRLFPGVSPPVRPQGGFLPECKPALFAAIRSGIILALVATSVGFQR